MCAVACSLFAVRRWPSPLPSLPLVSSSVGGWLLQSPPPCISVSRTRVSLCTCLPNDHLAVEACGFWAPPYVLNQRLGGWGWGPPAQLTAQVTGKHMSLSSLLWWFSTFQAIESFQQEWLRRPPSPCCGLYRREGAGRRERHK